MGVIKLEVPDVAAAIGVLEPLLKRKRLLLERSIFETTKKRSDFEERKGMSSKNFFKKFEEGLAGDDQDVMIWAAEYEVLGFLEKERIIIERMLESCR